MIRIKPTQFAFAFFMIASLTISCSEESETLNKSVIDKYSSFEVQVSAKPRTIAEIANTVYTGPESAYGQPATIDFRVNRDNTIDVFWIDNSFGRHITRISMSEKKILQEIPIHPDAKTGGRFLGFAKIENDAFIIGHSKTNAFGDSDAEAWYTAFDISGNKRFSTRIFGEKQLTEIDSKGMPAQAGSAVIESTDTTKVIMVYLAHTQRWSDNVRHQGGWVGFLDPYTGAVLYNSSNKRIGSDWFYSHNFDQRCALLSDSTFYTLAHGDAYPRALGIQSWRRDLGKIVDFQYYKIANGKTGDNTTLTTTGDLTLLPNGKVAIAYSTQDTRTKRDLRLALISGMREKTPVVAAETWITSYTNETVGWGTKISDYGKDILVLWNTFSGNTPKETFAVLLNTEGKMISEIESLGECTLYPTQSARKANFGKHIVWVSAGSGNSLKINSIAIE